MPGNTHGKDKIALFSVKWDKQGIFLSRPNRFIGIVKIDGEEHTVHIHDPGRLEELLYEGNTVMLKHTDDPKRKTRWSLIAARYENQWVFTNSGYHRQISESMVNMLFPDSDIRAEVAVGHSRLDFLVYGDVITGIEVKGCTLTEGGTALFPDAPTERGRKHIETLMGMMEEGKRAMLIVLIFRRDSRCFSPNRRTDPKFADILEKAVKKGLEVRPMLLEFDGETVWWLGEIALCQ